MAGESDNSDLVEGIEPETPESSETEQTESSDSGGSLLDAISNAVDGNEPTQTPDADEEVEEDAEAEESDDADGDASEEEDPEAPGERNPDGTFKAKDKSQTGDGTAEGAGKKPDVKQPNHVDDPIPQDIKGRTRERMESLIGTVKDQRDTIQQQHGILQAITDTGTTPTEFSAMVQYLAWIHTEDKQNLTQARDLLMRQLQDVSLRLGEAAPGVNFLKDHPELQALVDAGQISMDIAQELAVNRTRAKQATETTQRQTAEQQAAAAAEAERNTAISEMDALGEKLSKEDPDFEKKYAIIQPALAALGSHTPPKQWKAAFLKAYNAVKLEPAQPQGAKPAANQGGQKPPKGQPLRGNKTPSGSSARQPTSMLDAISGALEGL